MADQKESQTSPQPDIHKQYDRLITLIQFYVQVTWFVFGAFMITETVLLGAIAAAATPKDGPKPFVFGSALIGLLLTIPWWTSFRYNHALYLLRISEARNLEPAAGTFFTTGKQLIDGKHKESDIGRIAIPRTARILSPSRAVLFLIAIFFVAFAVILAVYHPSISLRWP